jgi:hypothetical protein
MKRTIILGFVFAGVIALASGCSSDNSSSSSRSDAQPPDYSQYSHLQPGQRGAGDTVGTAMVAHDTVAYPKAANPRVTPPTPRHNDVAELPED